MLITKPPCLPAVRCSHQRDQFQASPATFRWKSWIFHPSCLPWIMEFPVISMVTLSSNTVCAVVAPNLVLSWKLAFGWSLNHQKALLVRASLCASQRARPCIFSQGFNGQKNYFCPASRRVPIVLELNVHIYVMAFCLSC